ncbi:flagellar biosynthetic protein FliO [Caloramator proteoclasticus]|uniref:Flagellar protein FliO/FliZ n=1 Tax=Caloramator proteoclasticus DSM 10124 TaxID=1121262 RepID=A0A1M4ST43_9CLOT|nr:flagellar biosynthetic protein FliO [Caloramator proteoclasticus]SHE35349.1 hypothetical protein SAMN02746091_00226 [Caloramator proteoclasticus DSM 10124]
MNYIIYAFKILLILPFILFLIVLTTKILNNYQYKSKHIKVIDRVQIAPNSYILLIKIIDKTYVMSTNNNESKILFEIENPLELNEEDRGFNLLNFMKYNLNLKREDKE